MLCNIFNFGNVLCALQQIFFDVRHLVFKACGKNRQAHNLNKPDIFLFDVVNFGVRVENSQRMLLARAVVSEN